MIIDAHQHFWRIGSREGHWPPPSLTAIHRDFTPDDLLPTLRLAGVAGTVVVQSLPREDETNELLALAARHPFVLGVVGWTNLKAPDAADAIRALASRGRLVGLRPMLQDIDDPDWIDDDVLAPAIAAMIETGLRFDALVYPEHLPALARFARRHPDLPIVIDHGAKPDLANDDLAAWRAALSPLSDMGHVVVKLSGLLTEAAPDAPPDVFRSVIDELLARFGPERILWGSDWPVLRLAGEYDAWLRLCRDIIPSDHAAAVFGKNALRFYGLDSPSRTLTDWDD